jgi:arylsulfatase A-like enzyme
MRREFLVVAALAAAAGAVVAVIAARPEAARNATGHAIGALAEQEAQSPPNILVLVADDLGADKLGSYAGDADPEYPERASYLPQTPVLDRMAGVGLRFTDAWSNPTCSPTRATLYTGNHAFRTGIGGPLPDHSSWGLDAEQFTSMGAAALKEGYRTGLFGKWHLGNNGTPEDFGGEDWTEHLGQSTAFKLHPQSHGFDTFLGTLHGELDPGDEGGYSDWLVHRGRHCSDCKDAWKSEANRQSNYATSVTSLETSKWIAKQEDPWLAVVAFHAPHTPLEMPPEGCGYGAWDEGEDKAVYAAMVECLDMKIGEIFDNINDLENTLVFFVGDNGTVHKYAEDVFDDGRGKGTAYESGVRVPLIVAHGAAIRASTASLTAPAADDRALAGGPLMALSALGACDQGAEGAPAPAMLRSAEGAEEQQELSEETAALISRYTADPGREIADYVHVADIFSTVVEVAGGDPSTGADGVSMLPLMRDIDGDVRDWIYTEGFSEQEGQLAIRKGNWKLIAFYEAADEGLCLDGYELYNLATDRFEQDDLFQTRPEASEELLQILDQLAEENEGAWFDVGDC